MLVQAPRHSFLHATRTSTALPSIAAQQACLHQRDCPPMEWPLTGIEPLPPNLDGTHGVHMRGAGQAAGQQMGGCVRLTRIACPRCPALAGGAPGTAARQGPAAAPGASPAAVSPGQSSWSPAPQDSLPLWQRVLLRLRSWQRRLGLDRVRVQLPWSCPQQSHPASSRG